MGKRNKGVKKRERSNAFLDQMRSLKKIELKSTWKKVSKNHEYIFFTKLNDMN
jgi:hypothetical protein